ncbi:MAG: hypothetical protein U9N36_00440 [Euryarchaeota archaeon]|nr:hypothetical protein [Euryarchaeota archaeon]
MDSGGAITGSLFAIVMLSCFWFFELEFGTIYQHVFIIAFFALLQSMAAFATPFALCGGFKALVDGTQRAYASDFVVPELARDCAWSLSYHDLNCDASGKHHRGNARGIRSGCEVSLWSRYRVSCGGAVCDCREERG